MGTRGTTTLICRGSCVVSGLLWDGFKVSDERSQKDGRNKKHGLKIKVEHKPLVTLCLTPSSAKQARMSVTLSGLRENIIANNMPKSLPGMHPGHTFVFWAVTFVYYNTRRRKLDLVQRFPLEHVSSLALCRQFLLHLYPLPLLVKRNFPQWDNYPLLVQNKNPLDFLSQFTEQKRRCAQNDYFWCNLQFDFHQP